MKKGKSHIRRIVFSFSFLLAAMNLLAVPDSLIFKLKKSGGVNLNAIGLHITVNSALNNTNLWLFNPSDDYRFALRQYNDNNWKNVSSDFNAELDTFFKGSGWFRLHYKIDPEMNGTPYVIAVTHCGASEIFNDGKLIGQYGSVSREAKNQRDVIASDSYIPIGVSDTLEHVISIRYSNWNMKTYAEKYDQGSAGFIVRFVQNHDVPFLLKVVEITRFFFVGLSLFLFALALVHLIIFLFEKSRKFNLYYSIFVGTLAVLLLLPVIRLYIDSPAYFLSIKYYSDALVPAFFISVLVLLYNLFEKKLNGFFYIAFGVFVFSLIARYFISDGLGYALYATLFLMMYFSSTTISVKAIRQNFRGAKIVGIGVLLTSVLFILSIVCLLLFKGVGGIVALLMIVAAVLSLPLSMSVYLAYDFAKANETLKTQIVQIKDLSEKALREEAEKKQILENQNQLLETQVKERTAQITAQKEEIEEKNKDITDSINYAKRIQDATLSSKEIKYKLFPEAFVLFKPKDIVSGDFYWFAGKDGKRLISVCDCTGHGVPGALMSMIGNNLLNKVVNEKAITAPDKILAALDREVRITLQKEEHTDSKDGMDVALLSFNNENEVDYAGANRPLWIIREGKLEEIKATKISIGGDRYGADIQFQCHSLKLKKGDTVYISSDGFADQFNNDDKKLMTRRFKEILLSIQHLSMPEQEKYLDEFIEKWKGGLEQTDDILVIGIRV